MAHSHVKSDADLVEACVQLGLVPPFTAEQAKLRFRELAKLYHPDVGMLKNGSRFAQISHAYDLIEANSHRLAGLRLTLGADPDAAASQVADLLQQLHEARAKAVHAEKKLSDRADEVTAMRQFINGNRNGGLKRAGAVVLFCAAALFLGFLAGMVWSAQAPVIPLKPPTDFQLATANDITTNTVFRLSEQLNATAAITVKAGGLFNVSMTSATVELEKGGASLHTSPTLQVTRLPEIDVRVESWYPVVMPTTATAAAAH